MFILVFIITLLVLVVVHELGHFLAAKKFNIKVLEFGFGIPPRVLGKKFGETIISVNWLPFGGFVRLLGEDDEDPKAFIDNRSFATQNVWKRIAVVVAGIFMNLCLAWILFYVVIISQDFKIIYPVLEPVVSVIRVEEGSPAAVAGIRPGERLYEINGESVKNIDEAIGNIKSKPDQKIELTLTDIDGKNAHKVMVTTNKVAESGQGKIGAAFSPIPVKKYVTLNEKIFSGVSYSLVLTKLTFNGLGRTVNDFIGQNYQRASESVAGPIGLAVVTKNILGAGSAAFMIYIWFVASISLSLAIFNILPFPGLDGGRLFFLLIEAITKKRTHATLEKYIHTVGLLVLIGLIFLITASDISKLMR